MRKRNGYFILLILVVITVANLHFALKDINSSGITLNGLIQTASAESECPPEGCPYGTFCNGETCQDFVNSQAQACSIVDWCWCLLDRPGPPQWSFEQRSCQGIKTVCVPDPGGSYNCFSFECSGDCDPCSTIPSYPLLECQKSNPY